jgi:hypothetical protein
VEYDDKSGAPLNIDTLLIALLKRLPALAGQQAPPNAGNSTNGARGTGPALTEESIRAMSPKERDARFAEIKAWMAQNQ